MNRTWEVQGRNGYWAIDCYHSDDPGHGTYGYWPILRTRKDAAEVATAINEAYRLGRQDQMADLAKIAEEVADDNDDSECDGHEGTTGATMGVTTYCDGSCKRR